MDLGITANIRSGKCLRWLQSDTMYGNKGGSWGGIHSRAGHLRSDAFSEVSAWEMSIRSLESARSWFVRFVGRSARAEKTSQLSQQTKGATAQVVP